MGLSAATQASRNEHRTDLEDFAHVALLGHAVGTRAVQHCTETRRARKQTEHDLEGARHAR